MACSGSDRVLVCLFCPGRRLNGGLVFQRKVSLQVKSHGPRLILAVHVGPFRGFMN